MRRRPTTRSIASICLALVWPALLTLLPPQACAQADKPDISKAKSGIEVVGRSDKEKPFTAWFVDDPKTKKRVATEYGRWGFTAVPPGEYVVVVRQADREVAFATVGVEKDKVARVEVRSGIELAGRSDKEPPFHSWQLQNTKTKEMVTIVYGRWGYTPVPPGEYLL